MTLHAYSSVLSGDPAILPLSAPMFSGLPATAAGLSLRSWPSICRCSSGHETMNPSWNCHFFPQRTATYTYKTSLWLIRRFRGEKRRGLANPQPTQVEHSLSILSSRFSFLSSLVSLLTSLFPLLSSLLSLLSSLFSLLFFWGCSSTYSQRILLHKCLPTK